MATLLSCFSLIVFAFGSLVRLRFAKSSVTADLCFATHTLRSSVTGVALANPEYEAGGSLWHSMSDEELLRRASAVPRAVESRRKAKVAFMFLTRGGIPFRVLWERFFRGHDGLFSVYIHASPDGEEEPPEDSVFYRRRIPSKPVEWGRPSMLDAERRLLANALLDASNERFVLLSESCIPLFDFPTVYDYLIGSALSFVSSFDDPRKAGRGRYSRRMHPTVTSAEWRKGSQWFEVQRGLAVGIVSDRRYYPVFREHCRPPCYVDEHYLPTVVAKLAPGLNANRSVTWVDWSRGGSHPATYKRRDVSLRLMFARKFEASALGRLLLIADAAKRWNWH
ncbi:Core-2/I-Branching enzyme [Musa troglodytarum]|uniref:Core-2/I-Branching enzyme n=1 Tax=Musa troglodytarum TaxID=320322 RepID=A0A9E7L4I5_9LILI|nr:Core-2/I-Branching enzyme [Musa troglodytarum]